MDTTNWGVADIPDQRGKHIVVTGANSGIGFEAAQVLAGKGAFVTLACRSADRGEEARKTLLHKYPNAAVDLLLIDLADLASIKAFADGYREKHGELDVLINNAGVMVPPFSKTADGFELQFGCNHLGHFALTAHLVDLINAKDGGRIVVLSSSAHKMGKIDFENLNAEKAYRRWPAYGQSKLANLLFAYELQRRLVVADSATRVTAAHPGYAATNLQRSSFMGKLGNGFLAQSQFDGALPTLRAATDAEAAPASFWGPKGFLEMRGPPVQVTSNERSHDQDIAAKLWSASEQLVDVPFEV